MSTKKLEAPLGAFVKGGTTSSTWDREKKRQYRSADARRRHQDRQRQAVKHAAGSSAVRAALLSLQLGSPQNPKVCLTYKARDAALERDAICELIEQPEHGVTHYILVLVCPVCLHATGRQDDAQTMVNSRHKKLWLDESKRGIYVDPDSGMSYQLAGRITVGELCKCDALGCNWKFRIDDSKLYGSHYFDL